MSIFAEIECHFSAVSIAVYTALIHHFTCRLEACQALIYQLVSGLTGENGKYNYSIAVHVYPPFFDIPCSAKNYKIAPALTDMLDGFTDFDTLGRSEMEADGVRETSFGSVRRLSAPWPREPELGQAMG